MAPMLSATYKFSYEPSKGETPVPILYDNIYML